ncbi:MAG TPA: hypothetical protein VKR38_15900 [Usitatibacter sp.]|nr:hypothetical protein [Usitatibacter sp.]
MITILLAAAAITANCAPPRELDFWLGTWEVREGDKAIATSTIELASDGCVIRETYRENDGYNGTSLTFRDPVLKKWRQTWVDSRGAVGEFAGELTEGKLQFSGETHTPEGVRVYRRMSLAPEGRNVRQVSFASRDGTNWKPHYEYLYVPVSPR